MINKCKLKLDKVTKTSRWGNKEEHNKNKKRVGNFIDCLDKSSFVKIKDRDMAEHLIIERLAKNDKKESKVWDNLSKDKTSGKYFKKQLIDPSENIVFVDTNFLSKRKGNVLGGLGKPKTVSGLLKKGIKFESVPLFNVRTNKVEEGNHRVEAMRKKGMKSVPVLIEGVWD